MPTARIVKIAFKTKGDPAVYQLPVLRVDGMPFNPHAEICGRLPRTPKSHIKIVSA
jgi:hypothetical protein